MSRLSAYFIKTKWFKVVLLVALVILVSIPNLLVYIKFDFSFILTIIAIPFILQKEGDNPTIRFGAIAIGFLIIYWVSNMNLAFVLAAICTIFFVYESTYGKIASTPLLILIIFSPAAIFLTKVLGTEIRLELTKLACITLSLFDNNYEYSGNIILINGNEFHVDPACVGLNLFITSMFIGILFIAFWQKQLKRISSFYTFTLTLTITLFLIIFSNYIRIILLILFRSPPDSDSHQVIGLICFIAYVVVPLFFITKKLPYKNKEKTKKSIRPINKWKMAAVYCTLLVLMLTLQYTSEKNNQIKEDLSGKIVFEGYQCSTLKANVLKMYNDNFLLYIKPWNSFYTSDHSPLICWRGNGYTIQKENKIQLDEYYINFNTLSKGNDVLYATWWYDSGTDKTASQFRWRFKNLTKGDKYRIVNLISTDKNKLLDETKILLSKNVFTQK